MEWAVGKQGEVMRPGAGKLMLADSEIQWDIHYSAAGEEITDSAQLGVYLYPKDRTPEHRQVLHIMGAGGVDIPPNTVAVTEGFFPLQRGARIESYQPHMHLRGKAMSMEAIPADRTPPVAEPRGRLQLQLAQQLRLRRRLGAAAAQGHADQGHRVARQHRREPGQPRPPTSGSATATAPSTRWRTPGSM